MRRAPRRAAALTATVGLLASLATPRGLSAPEACSSARGSAYAYAGHQATRRSHGIRATIEVLGAPLVRAGHVAGWVGLGGRGQGPGGGDMWIQAGVASVPGEGTFVYAEIARTDGRVALRRLADGLGAGDRRAIAVLEMSRRPGSWRVWIDGRPVTEPIRLPGSSGRWSPVATAESWGGGDAPCNRFDVRFESVSVALRRGGSWTAFRPGLRLHDPGSRLHVVASPGRPAYSFVAGFR